MAFIMHVDLQNSNKKVLIDRRDLPLVEPYKWWLVTSRKSKQEYACASIVRGSNRRVLMHRHIMQAPPGVLVDHEDGNGLNNRRINMRRADHADNLANRIGKARNNSSGFSGVWLNKKLNKWGAFITRRGRRHVLGEYESASEAAEVRRAAEVILFGPFAPKMAEGVTGKYVGIYSSVDALVSGCWRQSAKQRHPARSPGPSGARGVKVFKDRFHARVGNKHLGTFATIEAAIAARDAYEAEHGLT